MRFSIRYKTLFGFAAVLVLAYITQFLILAILEQYVSQQTRVFQAEKASRAASSINDFINQITLHQFGIGREYLKHNQDNPDSLVKIIEFTLSENRMVNEINILSPSGRQLYTVNRYVQKHVEGDFEIPTPEFALALARKTGISKVYFTEQSNLPNINVFNPIMSETGDVVGVVKSQVQLNGLWDLIAQVRLGKMGFSYIVDDEGRLIAHPDFNLVLKGPNYSSRKAIAALKANTANSLKPDEFIYRNETGKEVISNGTKIQDLNWIVMVEQPVEEAFSQLNLLRTVLTGTILVSIILVLFASLYLSESFSRPILKLQAATEQMTKGDLEHRVYIHTGDEIEKLARSFNSMADKLKVSFSELKTNITELQQQKELLDRSAKLLLRRDFDLRQANEALEQGRDAVEAERRKLEIVLTGITDGVIAVDNDRKVIFCNSAAERITGFKNEDIKGRLITSLFTLFDSSGEVGMDSYCPTQIDPIEGVVFAKDKLKMVTGLNKISYVDVVVGQIKEKDVVNLGGIITFHDVTREQELEQMKLDFVSMAAHELRTPLTTIRGYISFLQDPKVVAKLELQEQEFLNRVSLSAIKLNELIQNLLAVAKIEQGKMQVRPVVIDMPKLLTRVTSDYQTLAKSKGLTLEFTPPTDPLPSVMADQLRTEEILTNLIGNAINYTQHGGVKLAVKQNGKFLETSVTDTGQGIPASAIPHLFTKFYRVQGELESGSKGTGLGLFICKNIVEAHGGKIWVESTEHVGSTFTFSLPIASETGSLVS